MPRSLTDDRLRNLNASGHIGADLPWLCLFSNTALSSLPDKRQSLLRDPPRIAALASRSGERAMRNRSCALVAYRVRSVNAGRERREPRRADGKGKIMDFALIARVLSMRRKLRAREHWTAKGIADHRQEQLRVLRAHAQAHSPFYRRFHAGAESKSLNELPVLTKSELMSSFDELVTDPAVRLASVRTHLDALQGDDLFLGKYRVTRTSGSTGHPGVFLSDPWEWATVCRPSATREHLSRPYLGPCATSSPPDRVHSLQALNGTPVPACWRSTSTRPAVASPRTYF